MNITHIKPKYGLLVVLFILLTSYSIFQARALLTGPRVWITSPEDGRVASNHLVVIEGQSRNVAWISLNGHQIFTDKEGNWSEKLIVSKGTSIMTVEASDRFGRETKKSVRIVLN